LGIRLPYAFVAVPDSGRGHPPRLFSADAKPLQTMADGTILVVKVGSTTFDNVTRAMQSLCENNVLGIVANGARASELYSKYTYYYSKTE